jgi:hypothetical protein
LGDTASAFYAFTYKFADITAAKAATVPQGEHNPQGERDR